MNLARTAWDNSAFGNVLELLEPYKPQFNFSDLRGFEWYYWNRLCHSEIQNLSVGPSDNDTFRVHEAFSPDGRRIVVPGEGYCVAVRDVATGSRIATLRGHSKEVEGVTFSKRLVSAGRDGRIIIWDARPWTPELKAEQEALGLLRFLCAKLPRKEQLIESIGGDATISEPVRRRALEFAETFWERRMAAEAGREPKE